MRTSCIAATDRHRDSRPVSSLPSKRRRLPPDIHDLDNVDCGIARIRAAASVESLVVKITAFARANTVPAHYVAADDASMIPGRSLSAKTMGRSVAPVAITVRPARMCQSRPSIAGVGRR